MSVHSAAPQRPSSLPRYLALLLLLVLFALLVFSVTMKSPTSDEQNHLARGLAYLRTGDLRLSQEHPPGVNAWEAWPLLLDPDVRLPLDSPSWANAEWYGFADRLLWRANDRPQTLIFGTRVPVMWLTLVLAALVYRWAHDLGGGWAGLSALALLVFDPNVLAHGRLTTTDMGVTCLSLAAMWSLWRALRASSWARWALAGVTLGMVQLSKFSALALGPVVLLIVFLAWLRLPRRDRKPWLLSLHLGLLLGASGVVVWAGYRFTWGPIPLLNGLSGPAPAYWSGIEAILRRTGGGNPAFLMGQYSREGWWYYFPIAFAIKTPLPTLVLLVTAICLWIRAKASKPIPNYATCLLLPVLAFWAMAVAGSFNIGYRHILPSLPFLYVLAGWGIGGLGSLVPRTSYLGVLREDASRIGELGKSAKSAVTVVSVLLFAWLAVGTFVLAPHYLAFFNAFAGGPDGGYRYLVDSNLDWGQDLPGLARYVEARGLERIHVSWFGAAYPEAYGLNFHPLPGFWRFGGEAAAYGLNPYAPAPGVYAISASNLQGVAFADHDVYAWFRERTPVARVGHSIHVYEVPDGLATGETVVLGVPMAGLADQESALLRRVPAVRRYDPETGLIVPREGEGAWFIAPEAPKWAQVVRQGPGYTLFQGVPRQMPPQDLEVRFSSFVKVLAYHVADASLGRDKVLTVDVGWGVERAPHRAAVSFAHLVDAEGRYVAGLDGLTAPATCWQEGDLVLQTYRIPLSVKAPGTYQVEIGWYDAETQERWPCFIDDQPRGNRYLLGEVEIKP